MGLWDVAFKHLLRLRPHDLLDLVPGIKTDAPLQLRNPELARIRPPKSLDGCVELESEPGGTLYHVEFEATPRSDSAFRAFEHFALAHCHGTTARPVRTVVFFLTPGTEGRTPPDAYAAAADGRVVCEFRFDSVRLWELDAEEVLRRRAPGLWAVVALSRGAEVVHVGRAAAQVASEVADEGMRTELLAVLYSVSGARFAAGALKGLIPREVLMRSTTYDEILQEGEERGLAKGRQEGESAGRLEGLRFALLRIAEVKLGAVPPALPAALARVTDPSDLEAALVDLTSAADPGAVLAVVRRLAS
ncbi:MAG TPA: hypothetical protein VGQ83_22470 [Polyangia bacterium]|jgi:hypothetical protein